MAKPRFRDLPLSATVLRSAASPWMDQRRACEAVEAAPRTLRDWAEHGLPVSKGPDGTPRYRCADLIAWVACYRAQCKVGKRPRHLTLDEALAWVLDREREFTPDQYVVVPLDHDHPRRELQLRRAVEGLAPPAEPSE